MGEIPRMTKNTEEHRIYALIEAERKERITSVADIHKRLDDIFNAIHKISDGGGQASWVRQSIGLTVAVIALIGFLVPTMVSIIRPMEMQIKSNYEDVLRHSSSSSHADSGKEMSKVQSDIKSVADDVLKLDSRIRAEMALSHRLLDERDINLKDRIMLIERLIHTKMDLLHERTNP
jgi:hypothetical protein